MVAQPRTVPPTRGAPAIRSASFAPQSAMAAEETILIVLSAPHQILKGMNSCSQSRSNYYL